MNKVHSSEIAEKRRILRAEYGGMMGLKDLMRELGYSPKSKASAYTWIQANALEGVRRGKSVVYETDQVAKAIVNARGMT